MGEFRYSSITLDFGNTWSVVSFACRPIYLWGKSSQNPLYMRIAGLQIRSGRCGEEKNLFPLLGIEPRFLVRPVGIFAPMSTEILV
jgi:hypothetical protein